MCNPYLVPLYFFFFSLSKRLIENACMLLVYPTSYKWQHHLYLYEEEKLNKKKIKN